MSIHHGPSKFSEMIENWLPSTQRLEELLAFVVRPLHSTGLWFFRGRHNVSPLPSHQPTRCCHCRHTDKSYTRHPGSGGTGDPDLPGFVFEQESEQMPDEVHGHPKSATYRRQTAKPSHGG